MNISIQYAILFFMTPTTLIIILIFLVLVNMIALWMSRRGRSEQPQREDTVGLDLILQQMNELQRVVDTKVGELNKTVDAKIGETTRSVNESMRSQFGESAKLIREVTMGLTKLDETNRQVVSFADQLQSLQDILKNPKQRGIIGEYYLETLLKIVLPPGSYQMQYPFSDGTIVDAVVFVKDKKIPIDNKIGALKDEDTENFIQRAASKYKVIIVSPTSFLAYLQTVMQGLKALQIEETAKDIIKRVEELGKHLKSFEDYHNKLGTSLSTVVNHYNNSGKEFKKIDKDVMRITGQAQGIEAVTVERPEVEE